MIITCPSCSARYPVEASTFAPSGRKVRCAKCGNTWHQAPPSDLGGGEDAPARPAAKAEVGSDALSPSVRPAPVGQKPLFNSGATRQKATQDAPAGPEAAKAEDEIRIDDPFSEDDDIMFAPVDAAKTGERDTPIQFRDLSSSHGETGGALRRYLSDVASMRRGRVVGTIGWVLLVLFVAGTVYGVIHYRREIVAFWPSTVRLYEAAGAPINLVGFELSDVTYERQDENGLPVLAISGEVVNISGETKRVPRLRVGLRDERQQELYHWTFALAESELKPDASAKFTTRLSSPPPAARDLEVRFVETDEGAAASTPAVDAKPQEAVPTEPAPAETAPHDDLPAQDGANASDTPEDSHP